MKVINEKGSQLKVVYGPAAAVDAVLFAIVKNKLSTLLIKINSGPYKNRWALPGGLVQLNESLDEAVTRILWQKTNIKDGHLEQLYTFGDPERDVRGQVISVAYFALIDNPKKHNLKPAPFYSGIKWFPIDKLPSLAFDHQKILTTGYKRLKDKMGYSNIVYSLLPKEFTLTQLQRVYEIVWGRKLDKRNFRKKVDTIGLIEKTGKISQGAAHRPAQLYRFKKRELIFTE